MFEKESKEINGRIESHYKEIARVEKEISIRTEEIKKVKDKLSKCVDIEELELLKRQNELITEKAFYENKLNKLNRENNNLFSFDESDILHKNINDEIKTKEKELLNSVLKDLKKALKNYEPFTEDLKQYNAIAYTLLTRTNHNTNKGITYSATYQSLQPFINSELNTVINAIENKLNN